MNTNFGLLGTKLGCTQYFEEDGRVRRVTAIRVGPCVVTAKKTPEFHGYAALQLGFGERREKLVSKAVRGHLRALCEAGAFSPGKVPRVLREFRVGKQQLDNYSEGQTIGASELFREGQFVDAASTSKGRGFTGVIKRHGFHGAGTATHGTHEYKRHGGSIGQNMTPGRTFPGTKMAGQHGNKRISNLNLRVAKVLADENIVLVEGSVPGPRSALVELRPAVKKRHAPPPTS